MPTRESNKLQLFNSFFQRTPVKKAKTSSSENSSRREDTKDPTWDLDSNKRVTVREFKGRTYIDVREYYLKDGDWLPGKKGISLQPGQWKKLLSIADEVNQALQ